MAEKPLDVYLNDHLAGATFGTDLARQLATQGEGTPLGSPMDRLAREIDQDGATQFVTPDQVAEQLACGPDVEEHVEIKPFIDAGYTEVALVQIGAEHQTDFISWAERELLPALRSL